MNAQLAELLPPGTDAFDYTGFEDRFRGSEALIAERQSGYLPLLAGRAPVADLGCGRGELLGLLNGAGIEAVGVDADAAQAARCRDKGLNVVQAELMQWIDAREAGSLGALVALQVVEHLSFANCVRLIEQAHRVLRPDGMVLFETVNPHCPEAMEWFYIDPTHRRPVYPEMLKFLLEQRGFTGVSVNFHVPTSTAVPGEPLNDKTGGDFSITGIRQ
jgi:O-antigen chain-terminating methyltransferase